MLTATKMTAMRSLRGRSQFSATMKSAAMVLMISSLGRLQKAAAAAGHNSTPTTFTTRVYASALYRGSVTLRGRGRSGSCRFGLPTSCRGGRHHRECVVRTGATALPFMSTTSVTCDPMCEPTTPGASGGNNGLVNSTRYTHESGTLAIG